MVQRARPAEMHRRGLSMCVYCEAFAIITLSGEEEEDGTWGESKITPNVKTVMMDYLFVQKYKAWLRLEA